MGNFECEFFLPFQHLSIHKLTSMVKIVLRTVSEELSTSYLVNVMQMKFYSVKSQLILDIAPMLEKRVYAFD